MPLINVKLIEDVFSADQKRQVIEGLTEAMVAIEGEAMRQVTWVVIEEVASGDWAIGGQPLTTPTARGDRYDLPAEDAEMSDRNDQRPQGDGRDDGTR